MTDIEHAKKYAEESISLAISMYNPKAEIIAETACLYGLTFKNEQIAELGKENAELKEKWLQSTDEGTSWIHRKRLEQENIELKELVKNIIRVTWGEGWNYSLDWKVKAEQFLKEE